MKTMSEVEKAIQWAREHAMEGRRGRDADEEERRIRRELEARRLDTGETDDVRVNAQHVEQVRGQSVFSLDALPGHPERAPKPGQLDRPGVNRPLREDYVARDTLDHIEDAVSDEPRIISHDETQRAIVRAVVDSMEQSYQEVFYHVFGQGLSIRQAAAEMRAPSHMQVQRAVDFIKERVAAALADAEDGKETPA